MNEAKRFLTGGDEKQKFRILCDALKDDCPDNVKEIVEKMEKEAGIVQP